MGQNNTLSGFQIPVLYGVSFCAVKTGPYVQLKTTTIGKISGGIYSCNCTHSLSFRFLWPCIVNIRWRERTNNMQIIRCFLVKLSISTCFGHHYAYHQGNKTVSYCMRCSAWLCRLWSCGAASWAVCTQCIMMSETCWDRKFDNKHRISCILLVHSLYLMYSFCLMNGGHSRIYTGTIDLCSVSVQRHVCGAIGLPVAWGLTFVVRWIWRLPALHYCHLKAGPENEIASFFRKFCPYLSDDTVSCNKEPPYLFPTRVYWRL